jgi:hypothetical protein
MTRTMRRAIAEWRNRRQAKGAELDQQDREAAELLKRLKQNDLGGQIHVIFIVFAVGALVLLYLVLVVNHP